MGLRQTAETDLAAIIEDSDRGFGWPIVVVDPAGNSAALVGLSRDISQVIDPDTGQVISGRFATVTLRMSSISASGLVGFPRGIQDETAKPWTVTFNDINGVSYTFKVIQGDPDRTIGFVTCILEFYDSVGA